MGECWAGWVGQNVNEFVIVVQRSAHHGAPLTERVAQWRSPWLGWKCGLLFHKL